MVSSWGLWRPFPNHESGGHIEAPIGPGVYEVRHADTGDAVARGIVRDAAEQIDELVRRLGEYGASRVALLGGLASSMEPWLAPDVQRRLVQVEGDAVDGALRLARRSVNAATGSQT